MNKKLILLILALPLFLMISLFTATNTVSLAVRVPVTGIDIVGDDVIYLDLDAEETYQVEYTVYPTNAQNKEVTFSTEPVEGATLADLEFIDGYVVPNSAGTAKVYLTTVDGGYKDSFIVNVDSSRLGSIDCSIEKDALLVGESVNISTVFNPENASDLLLNYESDNESVARVSGTGKITGFGRGTANITITSASNPNVRDTVTVTVYQDEPLVIAKPNVSTWNLSGTVNISVMDATPYTYSYKAYDESGAELAQTAFIGSFDTTGKDDGHILFSYYFADPSFIGKVRVEITAEIDGVATVTECSISRINEIALSFDQQIFGYTAGQNVMVPFTLVPEDAAVTYTSSVSNSNLSVLSVGDGYVALYAAKSGVSTLTLRATDEATGQSKETTVEIVVKPKTLIINESAKTFGDEDVLTVGKTEFDGSDSKIGLSLSYKASEQGIAFLDNLHWITDTESVLVTDKGVIKILDTAFTGNVQIRGVFKYKDVEFATAPMTVYCVGDGVNVRSFAELYATVEAGKPVVLHADIEDDFGYIGGQMFYNENTVTKIHTTYNDTYYKNINNLDGATVKVLLSFKNNLYGNGYKINAGNVTMQLDSTGALKSDALFRGPLNFVSMTESEASAVSVKAQDNICFALYEDVTLRNVKLYGCTLEADDDGNYDLTDLNYVGTTVEVLGDNVNILYSRIHNGRTVLRVFGDIADSTKAINLKVSNSVLGGAREFILRMGSNCFVDCPATEDVNNFTVNRLPGDNNKVSFPSQKQYSKLSAEEKQAYDDNFVKTFVTVRNSVFTDSGIFAIGVDSHFSGVYLAQGRDIFKTGTYAALVKDWYDIAKTSYGAKLTFEGDVRMYNWKNIDDVDSSTLIEIVGESAFAEQLDFDVSAMVKGVAGNENFKNILYNMDGKQYVHGGIAFFGGGKNYGVFEYKTDEASEFSELVGYQVSFNDIGKGFLASAAGNEQFYFLVHDSTTQFLPETQERLLNSKNAYENIYKK